MTWILETNKAIYWMEGDYYIDKIDKPALSDGLSKISITDMKTWFNSENPPDEFILKPDGTEPSHFTGHPGTGAGGKYPKPIVQRIDSDHYYSRDAYSIKMIILHNTEVSLDSTIRHFQDPTHPRTSAHYIVGRNGKIVQMVQDNVAAWHAGDIKINKESIGIEHEATDEQRGFTPEQEKSSIALIKSLMETYQITIDNVKPHALVDTMAGGTDCPRLLWGESQNWTSINEQQFEKWKQANLIL